MESALSGWWLWLVAGSDGLLTFSFCLLPTGNSLRQAQSDMLSALCVLLSALCSLCLFANFQLSIANCQLSTLRSAFCPLCLLPTANCQLCLLPSLSFANCQLPTLPSTFCQLSNANSLSASSSVQPVCMFPPEGGHPAAGAPSDVCPSPSLSGAAPTEWPADKKAIRIACPKVRPSLQ